MICPILLGMKEISNTELRSKERSALSVFVEFEGDASLKAFTVCEVQA